MLIRLDKALADEGLATRSEAKKLISRGLVTINGVVERNSAAKLERGQDIVAVDGREITTRDHIYLMLNKPAGYLSATDDATQPTVLALVPPELMRRGLFPAGRLDKDTTGLMILTDDGDFAHRLLAPKSHVPKCYLAELDIPVTEEMRQGFNAGIALKGEKKCMPAKLEPVDAQTARVTIREGMYHQIKRMFGCYGARVVSLRRISIGALPLDPSLSEGRCRELTDGELSLLQMADEDF